MRLGTLCPRSRDGLPDRGDLPENVRREPAKWVRPKRQRLHPLSAGPRLVSWPGIVRIDCSDNY